MSEPRAVRIPRGRPSPGAVPPEGRHEPPDVRPNRGGRERAVRIALVYAGAVLFLTAILSVLDLSGANATRPGVRQGLELFLGVAALLVVGSFLYAVSPAPRWIEVRPDEVVVVGLWGRRRTFAPLGSFAVQVVRHFPSGPLSPSPVDVVRIVDRSGRSRTYEVESGLFEPGMSRG